MTSQPWKALATRFATLRHAGPLLARVWSTSPRLTMMVFGLRVIRALTPLGSLVVGKRILDSVIAATQGAVTDVPWATLTVLVVLEFILLAATEGAARAGAVGEALIGDLVGRRMTIDLASHVGTLDLGQMENPELADQLQRARSQQGRVGALTQLLTVGQYLVTLISLSATLVAYAPWLIALLLIAVLPAFYAEARHASRTYQLLYRWTPERRGLEYLAVLGTDPRIAKERKVLDFSGWLVSRYETTSARLYNDTASLSARHGLHAWLLGLAGTACYYGAFMWMVVMTVYGRESPAGQFTVGTLALLSGAFRQSRDLTQSILLSFAHIYEQCLHLGDYFGVLQLRPEVSSPSSPTRFPSRISVGIEFHGVGFRYPDSQRWAVRDLSFRVLPGEVTALVGENGSGKSTIVKLLARLYDPSIGRITVDGIDLRDFALADLHERFGVLFQDFQRYDLTLGENIGLSYSDRPDASETIERAARFTRCHLIADRLPAGYAQMLGRRFSGGTDLSGGEWQRVALARSWLRDPQVLLLDEPTSALDPTAEQDFYRRMVGLDPHRIVVLVSHRLSTVRAASQILVLRDGVLVERGTHESLAGTSSYYAAMRAQQ